MNYEKDYEATMSALETALHKREQVDVEIESLHARVRALETLIGDADPHKGRHVIDRKTTAVQAMVNVVQPRLTERVRSLLAVVNDPLTSGEIYEKLKQLGVTLGAKSNPWALIHGICRRLVEQQFAREVDKGGRKAWVSTK